MPSNATSEPEKVRAMIRIDVDAAPIADVTDLYNRVRDLVRLNPSVRVELSVFPIPVVAPR